MTMKISRAIALSSLALAALATTGCEQPNWGDPAYISQQLEQKDPAARRVALGHLDALPDEKKREVVPSLTKVYMEKDANQKAIIDMLVVMRDPAAKDAYLEEVKTNAGGKAGAAAEALGESKAKDAIPAMLELLDKTDDPDVKQGILRGFTYMPDPSMVPGLLKLLALDVDNNPIALHAYSCEILGNLAQEQPQALNGDARDALVRGIFLSNNTRQSTDKECGLAVQQLGAPAIPTLIKTYKGEFEPVQQLMLAYKFSSNRPKGVATTRLVAMRAKEAGPLFIEDIQAKKELPEAETVSRDRSINYLTMEAQTVSEEILGLGDLGTPEARDTLVKAVKGELDENWEELKNAVGLLIIVQLHQNAATALNRIGDRSAAPALLDAAKDFKTFSALTENLIAVAKHNKTDIPDAITLYGYNIVVAQAYAYLADASGKDAYVSWVDSLGKDMEGLKKELDKFKPLFDLQAECAGKGDPKAQAACYGEKLKSDDEYVRGKAVYELTRLPSEAAAPVLAANAGIDKLNTRELVTFGLYRHPSKEALAKVEETLEKEKDRSGTDYKLDQRRLQMLAAWLKNNS
jgi:HEAT repeat protein